MLELAASGAKVLHIRAVEYARRHGVTLHVRSSFNNSEGTIVYDPSRLPEGEAVEESVIAGVAVDLGRGQDHRRRRPRRARRRRQDLQDRREDQRQRRHDRAERVGRRHRPHRHLVHAAEVRRRAALTALAGAGVRIGFESLQYDDQIGKLSLVGAAMRSATGVSAKLFEALYERRASTSR